MSTVDSINAEVMALMLDSVTERVKQNRTDLTESEARTFIARCRRDIATLRAATAKPYVDSLEKALDGLEAAIKTRDGAVKA